jgi:hypothetical protein
VHTEQSVFDAVEALRQVGKELPERKMGGGFHLYYARVNMLGLVLTHIHNWVLSRFTHCVILEISHCSSCLLDNILIPTLRHEHAHISKNLHFTQCVFYQKCHVYTIFM